ncbi:MAG: type II secretion system F family protein [Planctomycetes bacterium]|nr:type II secretion system F family protein [Planctomycetota bacterium]
MPEDDWEIRGIHSSGRELRERAQTSSVEALVERYRQAGVRVTSVKGARGPRFLEPGRCDPESFAAFNRELAAACRAGIPLPGAIRALSKELAGRRLRDALGAVARDVEGGMDLAAALEARGSDFPPTYVPLVRAGLESGDLSGILLDYAGESRILARASRLARAALVYPLLLALVGTCVLSFLATEVGGKFEHVFHDLGAEVPEATKILFDLLPAMEWAPIALLATIAAVAFGWALLSPRATTGPATARLLLRVPLVGPFCRAAALARFSRMLAGALARSVPVPRAILLAGMASGNAAILVATGRIHDQVCEGRKISEAIRGERLFPETFAWMVSMAEERGELAPLLRDLASIQEERMDRLGASLPFALSLAGTAVGGALAATAAVLLFLPLMSLIDQLG